jgi:polyhydroxybutyrate depolymerase
MGLAGPFPTPTPRPTVTPAPTPLKIKTPGDRTLILAADEHPNLGDRDRRYILHVPAAYDESRPAPVVIVLHGEGGTAEGAMYETGWTHQADRSGFLAVFPEGTAPNSSEPPRFLGNPQTWNDGSGRFFSGENQVDDIAFLKEILDDLKDRLAVDERRVFVVGFSNGGSLAFRAGIEIGARIAAIASVAGGLWVKSPKLYSPVSLVYMIGSDDPLAPVEGGRVRLPFGGVEVRPPASDVVAKWAEMLGCPAKPQRLRLPEGVHAWQYSPGRSGSEVVFYVIDGMGHTWPGGRRLLPERVVGKTTDKIKGNEVIWQFFRDHPKK